MPTTRMRTARGQKNVSVHRALCTRAGSDGRKEERGRCNRGNQLPPVFLLCCSKIISVHCERTASEQRASVCVLQQRVCGGAQSAMHNSVLRAQAQTSVLCVSSLLMSTASLCVITHSITLQHTHCESSIDHPSALFPVAFVHDCVI